MRQANTQENISNTKPRRRRRLKKSVKITMIAVVALIVLLVIKPWTIFQGESEPQPATEAIAEKDTIQSINMIVQNSDSDIPEAERFDKAVESFMRQWEIVGASLAIMKDGNLIYSKGYGYADQQRQIPTEVKHIFRIASVSKLITAIGIMKLRENGRLRLDSKVFGPNGILSRFEDYGDKRVEKMTVEDLLRHRGGFSTRAGDPMFDAAKMGLKLPVTDDQMVAFAIKRSFRYSPGSRTSYSNVGYMILGKVIEQVTGIPYERYIKDSILAPVGCYDMHIGHNDPADRHENEVNYYEPKNSELVPAADGSSRLLSKSNGGNNIELLGGGGGWVASPVEVLKLVAAIDYNNSHPNILSNKSIHEMTDYQRGLLPIGWINVNDKGDWWRSGTMAGTSAMMRRQSNGYTWVFVTNTSSWKGSRFAPMINSMLQRAFGKVTEWPEKDLFQSEKTDSI